LGIESIGVYPEFKAGNKIRTMKIAFFHELPQKTGSRKSVDAIAEHLGRTNTVDLYYVDKSSSYHKKSPFRKVHFFKFVPVDWKGGDPFARLYRDTFELLKLFFLHYKIAKKIRNGKYDFVFIHGSYLTESPFILLFKNNLKIYYAHAPNYTLIFEKVMGIPKKDRIRYVYEITNRHIRKWLDQLNVGRADLILANSSYTKNKITAFYKKKSMVAYLGVNTSIYKPMKIKKKYDFLFVGSMHPVDGYGLIHQALAKMRKKPSYKILAIENEWIDDDTEMANLYNKAKVVLCLAHGEPFGLVAIEAMACGVPVIAVDEAGYRESVINGKTGILIKRTPDDLILALKKLINDRQRHANYSKNSRREAVHNWSWSKVVKRMEVLIERKL